MLLPSLTVSWRCLHGRPRTGWPRRFPVRKHRHCVRRPRPTTMKHPSTPRTPMKLAHRCLRRGRAGYLLRSQAARKQQSRAHHHHRHQAPSVVALQTFRSQKSKGGVRATMRVITILISPRVQTIKKHSRRTCGNQVLMMVAHLQTSRSARQFCRLVRYHRLLRHTIPVNPSTSRERRPQSLPQGLMIMIPIAPMRSDLHRLFRPPHLPHHRRHHGPMRWRRARPMMRIFRHRGPLWISGHHRRRRKLPHHSDKAPSQLELLPGNP
jgi:hypothetical protein